MALKVLHPELQVSVTADRFLREIKLVSRIDHPLVARVLDSGEADWLVYYVMPFIDGPTLRIHLDAARRLSVDDTIRLGRDLLGALGAAHRIGIVHRDVKPENVVLSDKGAVLLDFGIARAIEAAGTDAAHPVGNHGRHVALHEPRAGAGSARHRPPDRPLLGGMPAVREPRRARAIPASERGRGAADASERAGARRAAPIGRMRPNRWRR